MMNTPYLDKEIAYAKEKGLTHREAELIKLKAAIPFKVVYSPEDKWAAWVLAIHKPEKYGDIEDRYTESPEMIAEMQALDIRVVDAMMRMAPLRGFGLMYMVESDTTPRPYGEFTHQFLPGSYKVDHLELFKED